MLGDHLHALGHRAHVLAPRGHHCRNRKLGYPLGMEDSDASSSAKALELFYGGLSDSNPNIGVLHITLPVAPIDPPPPLTLDQALAMIVAAIADDEAVELRGAFETVDEDESGYAYRQVLEAVLRADGCGKGFRDAFHLSWTIRGFRHREALADDNFLISALRCIFPPYTGSPLTLYRGEQAGRWEAGRVGLNWSPSREVGRMFAAGLCTTYDGDGVLLCSTAPPEAVIALPNYHSGNWLHEDEHIVDPALLIDVREIDRFPPDRGPTD